MMKLVTATIVAGALVITGAAAGPLGGTMTASQTADEKAPRNGVGILAYFIDQLSVSVATVAGSVGYSAEETDDKSAHSSNDECNAGEDATEAEDAKSEKFKQAGPEPIYFGF
ncbi:hypothetical protein MNBD_ALPHA05-1180 [hydrothermal vent metagenome]|uniref:Uncharacterized protein n=1 Tax=hydrothermal vent metagenome TaxID=652676 RepID=A0A3B0SCE0_9ZZZZ